MPLTAAASLEHPAGRLPGQLEDVGSGGVFFATPTLSPELKPGTRVTLVLPPHGAAGAVRHTAVIVRVEDLLKDTTEYVAYRLQFDEPVPNISVAIYRA